MRNDFFMITKAQCSTAMPPIVEEWQSAIMYQKDAGKKEMPQLMFHARTQNMFKNHLQDVDCTRS